MLLSYHKKYLPGITSELWLTKNFLVLGKMASETYDVDLNILIFL